VADLDFDTIARSIVAALPADLGDDELRRVLPLAIASLADAVDSATRAALSKQVTWRVLQLRADCDAARQPASQRAPNAVLLCDDVAPHDMDRLLEAVIAASSSPALDVLASVSRQLLGFASVSCATAVALLKCVRARLLAADDALLLLPPPPPPRAILSAVLDWLSEFYADLAVSERRVVLPIVADILAVYASSLQARDGAQLAQCIGLVADLDAELGAVTVLPIVVNRIAVHASLRDSPLRTFLTKSLAGKLDDAFVASLSTHDFLARHRALLQLLASHDAHERAAADLASVVAQIRPCAALTAELARLNPAHRTSLHVDSLPLFNNDVALVDATRAALKAVLSLETGQAAAPQPAVSADDTAQIDVSGMFYVDKAGRI
jgi:hypothetical protein